MGSVWLGSLPDVIRNAGLNVSTWPGWETRSRSSGGYDSVWAIGVHHDASPTGTSLENRCRYAWQNATDRPIGAIYLHSDGRVMVGAAGATNTQGRGGPRLTTKGVIPKDQGNRYMLSIEASNNGVGQPWPQVQQDAYVRLCAALCAAYGLTAGDVVAHFEWTNRKIDPAGPSRYAGGRDKWNMDLFRSDVFTNLVGELVPPPTPMPGGSDVIHPIAPFRNSDSRVFGGKGLAANTTLEFGLDSSKIPANAVAVALNVAVVSGGLGGWCAIWPAGQPFQGTATVNFDASKTGCGSTVVGVKDLKFNVKMNTPAHVIVDVTGYWTP